MTPNTKNIEHIFSRQLWLIIFFLVTGTAIAAETTPEQIEGATRINAEELINLAGTLPDLIIIDARIRADRVHGYIEGSISLPNTKTDCDSLARIVRASDIPTVYYCNGPKCGRSLKSIKIALSCGYSNIYWYRDGFEDWKGKDYPFLMAD